MAEREEMRRALERLTKAVKAELATLQQAFEAEMAKLLGDEADRSGARSEIEALIANHERQVAAWEKRLAAQLSRWERPASKRPIEELRRRSTSSARRRLPKWPPKPRPSAGGVTVTPDKPLNLSGGAAAPLEFD